MRHRFATDRWLFLSTIALCLVGAVMVLALLLSPRVSNITARTIFLIRQAFVARIWNRGDARF